MKGLEMNETIKLKVEFVAKNLDAVGQEVGANLLRKLAEENEKLRELVKEAKSLIKELCQTYNNPFPDSSFERFNEALKD